jgi:hypothetical protein
MAIGKKKRFAIFERDNFTCQYCGNKPPKAILEVDHIVSRKDGGQDDDINLTTSCFLCNRGKSSKSVDINKIKKGKLKKELKFLKEQKDQLVAYYYFLEQRKSIEKETTDIYINHWNKCSGGQNILTDYGASGIKSLCEKYTSDMIFEAMEVAWDANHVEPEEKYKYMCGVLKNLKLKEDDPEQYEIKKRANKIYSKMTKTRYVNSRLFWKWITDGIEPEVIYDIWDDSANWNDMKEYILNTYYEK